MRQLTFEGMKFHYVPDAAVDTLKEQMLTKHGVAPAIDTDVKSAFLDAGGMWDMKSQALKLELESETFEVKPEHIYSVLDRWERFREYGAHRKVYLRDHCIFLSRELHQQVWDWLKSNLQAGIDARANIAARLADCPNIYVHVPSIAKEAGEA